MSGVCRSLPPVTLPSVSAIEKRGVSKSKKKIGEGDPTARCDEAERLGRKPYRYTIKYLLLTE